MLEKIARQIVKRRLAIAVLFLLATAASAIMIPKAVINYDFTDYLSRDTMTGKSLEIMKAEFGNTDQITLMFENLPEGESDKITEEMKAREGILRATHDAEKDVKVIDGVTYERVELFLDCPDSVAYAKELSDYFETRENTGAFHMTGAAPQTLKVQSNLFREIPLAMAIALAIVVAVLFMNSHSYIEPVLFFIVLVVSIVLNMGTNWIFPSISFVTFAVAAILQLALAMDYSIMLLHNYFDAEEETENTLEAVRIALFRSFMPVTSSSFTTIAGLAALMFMSFTVGFDIGIVLSKGIVFSLLTVFLLMPALILLFAPLLRKTRHKPMPLGAKVIGGFAIRFRRPIAVVLILCVAVGMVLQTKNEYVFTDVGTNIESDPVSDIFGISNQLVLLFPTGISDEALDVQRSLIDELTKIQYEDRPAVTSVTSIVTTGEAAVRYYDLKELAEMTHLPAAGLGLYLGAMGFGTSVRGDTLVDRAADLMPKQEMIAEIKETLDFARSMFIGKEYARMILLLDIPNFGNETYRVLDEIQLSLEKHYPGAEIGMAGNSMSSYDISSAFTGDVMRVNLITIAAIFLIVMLSFRSVFVPIILICVIQGAIWITMAISALKGEGIFFMSYLICSAIQMGATIDYAILLASNYRTSRKNLSPEAAAGAAIRASLPTVFTSGVILTFAGFAIGKVCTVFYVSSIGSMIARGTLISLVLVLTLLPALMILLDKPIMRGLEANACASENNANNETERKI